MSFLKKINVFRKWATKLLRRNISGKQRFENTGIIEKEAIKRILICRPNHRLGNQLLITPLVQEVSDLFPDAKIDLFVKGGIAAILYKNYPTVDHIISLPKKHFSHLWQYVSAWFVLKSTYYDLVINAAANSSSGNLAIKLSNAPYKFFGNEINGEHLAAKYSDYEHMAKHPIYGLRDFLSTHGITTPNLIPSLDIRLGDSEIANGKKLLEQIASAEAKVISLFTFATGEKMLSPVWWETFYNKLAATFPNYSFIEILPIENVSQLDYKIPTFYSKDVREIAAVIANTNLFIGADSGMMHLASASLTPTVGLFGATTKDWYQPYNNNSLGMNSNDVSQEAIIKEVSAILKKRLHFVSDEV